MREMSREAMGDIAKEIEGQESEFAESSDDRKTPEQWLTLILFHLGVASDGGHGFDVVRYERQLVRVAATCASALASMRRKKPREPRKGWKAGTIPPGSGV